jgi:hypothetical protein
MLMEMVPEKERISGCKDSQQKSEISTSLKVNCKAIELYS